MPTETLTSPPEVSTEDSNSALPFAVVKRTELAAESAETPRSQTFTVSAPVTDASIITVLPLAPIVRIMLLVGKTVHTPFSTMAGALTGTVPVVMITGRISSLPSRTMSASLSSVKFVSLPMESAIL